jgi:hypothetical protein
MQVCQKLAQEVKVICRERYLEAWGGHNPDRPLIAKHKENIAALMRKYFPPQYGVKEVSLELKYCDHRQMCFVVVYEHRSETGELGDITTHGCEVDPSLSEIFTVKVKGLARSDGNDEIKQYMTLRLMKEVDDG